VSLLIKSGNIVNYNGLFKGDILIEGSTITKVARQIKSMPSLEVIDAKGKYVFPGFIDMHVHLRTPGREDEETLESGSEAAAAGGVTTLLCMPNTEQPLDTQQRVGWIRERLFP
jgi:dihydroorotase